jgi:hypothetical protein
MQVGQRIRIRVRDAGMQKRLCYFFFEHKCHDFKSWLSSMQAGGFPLELEDPNRNLRKDMRQNCNFFSIFEIYLNLNLEPPATRKNNIFNVHLYVI